MIVLKLLPRLVFSPRPPARSEPSRGLFAMWRAKEGSSADYARRSDFSGITRSWACGVRLVNVGPRCPTVNLVNFGTSIRMGNRAGCLDGSFGQSAVSRFPQLGALRVLRNRRYLTVHGVHPQFFPFEAAKEEAPPT